MFGHETVAIGMSTYWAGPRRGTLRPVLGWGAAGQQPAPALGSAAPLRRLAHPTWPVWLASVPTGGPVARFARWGLLHGPAWGLAGVALAALPLSLLTDPGTLGAPLVAAGVLAGLGGGPALGVLVGLACLAADRVPKWILDAPDYVAAAVVLAAVGGVAWPVLGLGAGSPQLGGLAVLLLAAAPVTDAARNAEALLRGPGPSPLDQSAR